VKLGPQHDGKRVVREGLATNDQVIIASGGMARVRPGMVAMDLSAGGGYTTELVARAVGPAGKVYGQSAPPPGVRFTQVSAGSNHTCGILPDGSALCWGGSCNPWG